MPRRLLLPAALVALVLAALEWSPARSEEGLYLGWNGCRAVGGASNRNFNCVSDLNVDRLVLSFGVAAPVDSVIGVEAVVDVQFGDAVLPAWWRFDPSGCRSTSLGATVDLAGDPACANPWGTSGSALIQGFLVGAPFGAPNQCRILATANVPSTAAARMEVGQIYDALAITIDHFRTEADGCTGCTETACLVFNSLRLVRLPAAAGGDVLLTVPGPALANQATWQGGAGADCSAVPAHGTTWGRLKALYR